MAVAVRIGGLSENGRRVQREVNAYLSRVRTELGEKAYPNDVEFKKNIGRIIEGLDGYAEQLKIN